MKKQGFTLAELLITLGIIGVAAALLVPNLGKILPDRNKITVLNTAKVINEITTNLMNNDGLYYNIDRCVGLACNATPKTAPYNDNKYSGDSKYSRLLISNLNVDGDVNEEANASAFKFKTTDGVFWTVTPTAITGGATIMIDVNGESKGKNCSFDTSSCKKPDQYVFVVDQMGKLHPGDPLTAAYTMNQTKTKNKKNDYTLAANFSDKTKDWQGLTLVVGRDRTDTGCVGDECKDGITPPDPCEGLSEKECYCIKNPGACEDPCKSNPNLPECKKPDPCAGKTGLALTCCKNPNATGCGNGGGGDDDKDPCKSNPNLPECKKPNPCEGLKGIALMTCQCKVNGRVNLLKPDFCTCILVPELDACELYELCTGDECKKEPTPKDDMCLDHAVHAGVKCHYTQDRNIWWTEHGEEDGRNNQAYAQCVYDGGLPSQCSKMYHPKGCVQVYGHNACYDHGPKGADETPHKVD